MEDTALIRDYLLEAAKVTEFFFLLKDGIFFLQKK